MEQTLYEAVSHSPIIAAVKNQAGLEACLENENIQVVFLLYGDLMTIAENVSRVKLADKMVVIHLDFIAGLQCARDVVVDFVKNNTEADGIVTTHPNCVRRAKELGLYTILRTFVLDSIALANIPKLADNKPDFIEILPGPMPKVIHKITEMTDIPVLAGGLIEDKEDVIAALDAGATGISSTDQDVWNL